MFLHVGKTISPIVLCTFVLMVLSCAPDLSERIRQYVTAYNSHDVEKIMSFYTHDIRFENVGVWVKTGKQEVRKITEWDVATHIVMRVANVSVQGDTVTFLLFETNDWLQLAGIGEVLYEPTQGLCSGMARLRLSRRNLMKRALTGGCPYGIPFLHGQKKTVRTDWLRSCLRVHLSLALTMRISG